jgi:hypothetical protein
MASPTMMSATSILKRPEARISKITEDITLPRSISVKSFIAGIIGFIFGIIFYNIFYTLIFSFTITSFLVTSLIFTFLSVFIINYQPLRGESWGSFINLQAGTSLGGKVEIDGKRVKAYIGIARLNTSAAGKIKIISSAQEVLPGSVDERGVSKR